MTWELLLPNVNYTSSMWKFLKTNFKGDQISLLLNVSSRSQQLSGICGDEVDYNKQIRWIFKVGFHWGNPMSMKESHSKGKIKCLIHFFMLLTWVVSFYFDPVRVEFHFIKLACLFAVISHICVSISLSEP